MKTKFTLFSAMALSILLTACGSGQPTQTHSQSGAPQTDELMDLPNKKAQTSSTNTAASSTPFFNEPATSVATTGFLANPNVQQYIQYQKQHHGMNEAELIHFFSQVRHRSSLIATMDRPGTSRPWYEFQKGNSGTAKINAGRKFYAANRAVIDRAAAQYGVPAEIIVAIIGIETHFGTNKGNVRVADSLATLAFDYPRRGAFFQNELTEFLKMSKEEGYDPFHFTGSFAGAMGLPQFMPSSYRKWAIDGDGDGKRNIWNSVPDAVASVANYIKGYGWQTGGRMIVPVSLQITPQLQDIIDEKTALTYSVKQLKQMGVVPLESVSDNEKAVLFRLETSPGYYEYYIGLNNFYTIWRYNNSRMYVTAVRDIANGIKGGNL